MSEQFWDEFWLGNFTDYENAIQNPKSWGDICTKLNLETTRDLIEQEAFGNSFLECGCGVATMSRFLSKSGWKCTMVDSSSQALSRAKHLFNIANIDGEFRQCDIKALPYSSDSFDVIYIGGVLEFFDNPKPAILEMLRVLKPGGLLLIKMVPARFSAQTIGDWQRYIAHRTAGFFGDNKNFQASIPQSYNVKKFQPDVFFDALAEGHCLDVKLSYMMPFPQLSLPTYLQQKYTSFLLSQMNFLKSFGHNNSHLSKFLGVSVSIVAKKAH